MADKEPMFPIMNDPIIKALPWAAMRPHEEQAQRNHSQTLNRLASRGGLGIEEAYHILRDEPWPRGTHNKGKVRRWLMWHLCQLEDAQVPAPPPKPQETP